MTNSEKRRACSQVDCSEIRNTRRLRPSSRRSDGNTEGKKGGRVVSRRGVRRKQPSTQKTRHLPFEVRRGRCRCPDAVHDGRGGLVRRAGGGSGRRRTGPSTLLSQLRLVHVAAHGHAQLKGRGTRGRGQQEGHAHEGEAGGHGGLGGGFGCGVVLRRVSRKWKGAYFGNKICVRFSVVLVQCWRARGRAAKVHTKRSPSIGAKAHKCLRYKRVC